GHYIASRAGARIIHDRVLIHVAELIAASIIWLKDYPALCGHDLSLRRECFKRGRGRTSVNDKHQRILLRPRKIRRIRENSVVSEAVSLPRDHLRAPENETRDFGIEVGQAFWRRHC